MEQIFKYVNENRNKIFKKKKEEKEERKKKQLKTVDFGKKKSKSKKVENKN